MIANLIVKGDSAKLKQTSQHAVWNAWYEVKFGHECGVHACCPIEALHWILLGMYKYTRECLFEQAGPTSQLSENLNACAITFGALFQRQSDKDVPRTKFSKGVMKHQKWAFRVVTRLRAPG